MPINFEQKDNKSNPYLFCEVCGLKILSGNGLAVWAEEGDVKFIHKGIEKCENFEGYKFGDTIEHFFYLLMYNSRCGIIKKPRMGFKDE